MDKEAKKMEDRFFFRPKKRKPEVLLQDVFKAMKSSILLHKIGSLSYAERGRIHTYERMKRHKFQKYYQDKLPYVFFMTKPMTGVSMKDCEKLAFNLQEIREFRKRIKEPSEKIKGFFVMDHERIWTSHNNNRIFPLSADVYQKIAERIWERDGKPSFNKYKINGVRFGQPVTRRNPKYGYWNNILSRWVGVVQEKIDGKWKLISRINN